MLIVSYDISDTKLRTRFAKMLKKEGAIRLQLSVYEINNTQRVMDNVMLRINSVAKHFTGADSVMIFDVASVKVQKFGNAIHRDTPIVYL